MSRSEVDELLGFRGSLASRSGNFAIYQWTRDDSLAIVTVSFTDGEVSSKSQVGLD